MNRRHYYRVLALLAPVCLVAGQARADYVETKMISNEPGVAPITDPNLIDPWGLAFSATSPLWVSNQGSGTATVYKITGTSSSATLLTEGVANIGGAPPSDANGPTGQVSTAAPGTTTGATDFQVSGSKAAFIFDNLDSSISAWRGGLTSSVITATVADASFTGLAIGNTSTGAAQIYAADQNSGNVDIFNSLWQPVGALTDPSLPAGFTAFNVQNINGTLFVTYANPNEALGGVVDEFSTNGTMITRLITDPTGTHLQTPWGIALAPAGWGQFGGDLLIGNNGGDGTINAYSLAGVQQGQITLDTDSPFSEQQLWGLTFGNGASAGSPDILYFSAGYTADATNGLIGAISLPEPSAAVLGLLAIGQLAGGRRLRNCRRAARS
ncbi:MAG: TIGR03118 family protein [Tepidisphaeraceae bacterium]|jgi:uncharacterized protein (TIGR03118 family)